MTAKGPSNKVVSILSVRELKATVDQPIGAKPLAAILLEMLSEASSRHTHEQASVVIAATLDALARDGYPGTDIKRIARDWKKLVTTAPIEEF